MPQKAQKAQEIRKAFCAVLWLISFVAVRLSVVQRGGASRTVVVAPGARRRVRQAGKARVFQPPSSQLVYKTSSALTVRPGDSPAPGARKHRLRSRATSRPQAPESAVT